MTTHLRLALAAAASLTVLTAARAQDLYDTTVLRTLHFQFQESNWETILRNNYISQTNLLGTLTVDGVTYTNVGVRIRGNTSYTALPSGSQKFSLNVELDAVDPEQDLMGYSSLNLNNAFHDPTFCREVLYNNYVAQFIPNPRANHVIVTINGVNWGVYANIQQFNKRMLSTHFADTGGLRIKCANNPNGPGLRYNGATAAGYTGYEIKDPGGFADPYAPLIAVCNAVTNGVVANWPTTIDPVFAVDPSIWSVVLENFLTDDDSYVNKGADFMTYRNPTDGRTFLLQTDANETFTQSAWAINRNFTATTKPVLSRVLSVPELRQRYMAHYRTVKQDLNWAGYWEPRATALRNLIDAAVQADTKKLYSYALFQTNFTSSVNLGGSPPFGGTVPGLQQFINDRLTFLNSSAELVALGPTIASVVPSDDSPDPSQAVSITANVTPPSGSTISKVELFYRPSPAGTYQRVLMTHTGGGVYTAPLPVAATPGQRVAYYVAATAGNAFASLSFFPARTEWAPLTVNYTFGASGGIRITEWMYSGANGEFVEFTNVSTSPIDMTGWSFDDDHATAGAFSLSGFGTVQPGESFIITEADAAVFRSAWGLGAGVKILGGLGSVAAGGNNLARNDELNLYDASGILVDRLTYGDQTFPGTIRTQNFSGQTCREAIGQDMVSAWVRSAAGDVYGSFASTGGDRGTPGTYTPPSCFPCTAPGIGTNPVSQQTCLQGPVSFSVIATGTGPLAYQWQVEVAPPGSGVFANLSDGPLPGVATVSGASTASISLSGLLNGATATFRCTVTNACGNTASDPAALSVCTADFNCSGGVTVQDIFDFLAAYFVSDPTADVNGIGGVTVQDIFDYLTTYFVGCD